MTNTLASRPFHREPDPRFTGLKQAPAGPHGTEELELLDSGWRRVLPIQGVLKDTEVAEWIARQLEMSMNARSMFRRVNGKLEFGWGERQPFLLMVLDAIRRLPGAVENSAAVDRIREAQGGPEGAQVAQPIVAAPALAEVAADAAPSQAAPADAAAVIERLKAATGQTARSAKASKATN